MVIDNNTGYDLQAANVGFELLIRKDALTFVPSLGSCDPKGAVYQDVTLDHSVTNVDFVKQMDSHAITGKVTDVKSADAAEVKVQVAVA